MVEICNSDNVYILNLRGIWDINTYGYMLVLKGRD